MYYIYKIKNLINGKEYIGLTTRDIKTRWKEHVQVAYSNHYGCEYALHSAIKKYGKENFIIEIIDTAEDLNELRQKEIYYIGYYNTYTLAPNSNGYNMTLGGELNKHMLGELSPVSKNSDEQRWKIIHLLSTTNMYMKDIAKEVGLNSQDGEKLVSMINNGENFRQEGIQYPIRARSVTRKGSLNPAAHDEEVIKRIINLLETTYMSQKDIALMCGVHYNTVSNINTCKSWTYLHHYKQNIQKEARLQRKEKI